MNKCKSYGILCPYALVVWEELPCFATQEKCDKWRERKGK